MKAVSIIDYGMGNLGSVRRAFEECGASVQVIDNATALQSAERIVLPGVGAFRKGFANLQSAGWLDEIREAVVTRELPLLGICLGMQLLAEKGFEGGESAGLALIPGEVRRLEPTATDMRIPHVGWNEVHVQHSNPLFENIPSGTDFYFVHSFHMVSRNENVFAKTPYCGNFASAVGHKNIFGVQFHPEKSQKPGFQLIRNFLSV